MSLCFGTSFGEFLFIEPWSISMIKCLALGQLKMIPKNVKNHSNCASGITSGFALAMLGGFTFCALVAKFVKKWSHGFGAILVGNCHKCMQNEVWKVFLQKEFILVGFSLTHVRWIRFLCLGSKIGEKVMSWFLSNLGGELSQMYAKWGVKSLVVKEIDIGSVLA